MTFLAQLIIAFFINNFTYPLTTYLFVVFLFGFFVAHKIVLFLREYS